ncbi:LOB domain-containing protein 12-like [Humulus lupulus]|uniref:LOB domain-containing protein 12-like n=1 Tax=Humulus lupulus TaxID=3486 RepID=UPI002B40FE8D|nr:LOB domain-containing protein 12-like [Humulus lupulus]
MVGNSPCASCKLLRRRCAKDCVFAPYFASDDPHKFAIVHKVFGASNVSKMLQELPIEQRADAVSSLVYEANARMRDPVYGCVGAISYLQNQVSELQMQLAVAQAEILCIQMQQDPATMVGGGVSGGGSTPPVEMDPVDQINYFGHYDKSCFLGQNNNGLMTMSPPHHHQYHNFSSSTTSIVIHDSLKRETLFGNDMVS